MIPNDTLIFDQHLGSSPYGPNVPRPSKRALCAPLSDTSSREHRSFANVPDDPQT